MIIRRIIVIIAVIALVLLVDKSHADEYTIMCPSGYNLSAISEDGNMLGMIIGAGVLHSYLFVFEINTGKIKCINGSYRAVTAFLTWCNLPDSNMVTGLLWHPPSRIKAIVSGGEASGEYYYCYADIGNSSQQRQRFKNFDGYYSWSPSGKQVAGTIVTKNKGDLVAEGHLGILNPKNGDLREIKESNSLAVRMPVWTDENTIYILNVEKRISRIDLLENNNVDITNINKIRKFQGGGWLLGAWQGKCVYVDCDGGTIYIDDETKVKKIIPLQYGAKYGRFKLRKGELIGRASDSTHTSLIALNFDGEIIWKHKIEGKYSLYEYDATRKIVYLWMRDKPTEIYRMKIDKKGKPEKIFDLTSEKNKEELKKK